MDKVLILVSGDVTAATSPVNSLGVPPQGDICKSYVPYVVVYVGAFRKEAPTAMQK